MGLQIDRSTALSTTGIVNAQLLAAHDAVGELQSTQYLQFYHQQVLLAQVHYLVLITTDAGMLSAKRVGTCSWSRCRPDQVRPNALVST